MKKLSIIFLFLIFICSISYAYDFFSFCNGGDFELTIEGVVKKISDRDARKAWVTGDSCHFLINERTNFSWIIDFIDGPALNDGHLSCTVHYTEISSLSTLHDECSVNATIYYDNSAPKPEMFSSSGAK